MHALYTTKVTAIGGREGQIRSEDGLLDVKLALPRQLWGNGDATNPETLFAGAWEKSSLHLRGNIAGFEAVQGPKQRFVTHPDSFLATQLYYATEDFLWREMLPWHDHHLKGVDNGMMERPAIRFCINGENKYAREFSQGH